MGVRVAPALIGQTVRFALDHGYHVVLEEILKPSSSRGLSNRSTMAVPV